MNCYDFIHIYVPDGNGWINYSDITPVTEWVDKGGIVQLMWHFNVPVNESTKPGMDGSGVTCSPDKTTFRASNALQEGTWEHQYFYEQMDRVIAVILKLQEAGIAATWRPFHRQLVTPLPSNRQTGQKHGSGGAMRVLMFTRNSG